MNSTPVWLCPDLIFDGTLREGMALCADAGLVADLRPASDLPPDVLRQRVSGLVTPGFLDLQVNGGGDVLLNTDPTAEAMRQIAAAHRRFGTVGILPTVITDAPDILARAVAAALAAKGWGLF